VCVFPLLLANRVDNRPSADDRLTSTRTYWQLVERCTRPWNWKLEVTGSRLQVLHSGLKPEHSLSLVSGFLKTQVSTPFEALNPSLVLGLVPSFLDSRLILKRNSQGVYG